MTTRYQLILFLGIVLLVTSCQDHQPAEPHPTRSRFKQMLGIRDSGRDTAHYSTTYEFDEANRPKLLRRLNGVYYYYVIAYEYDVLNRLTLINSETIDSYMPGYDLMGYMLKLTYSPASNYATSWFVTAYDNTGFTYSRHDSIRYELNAAHQLVRKVNYAQLTGLNNMPLGSFYVRDSTSYVYTGGNLTQTREYHLDGAYSQTFITTYEYDTGPNPYLELYGELGDRPELYHSKNNKTKRTDQWVFSLSGQIISTSVRTYVNSYDAQGRLSQVASRDDFDSAKEAYYYEAY
ncbi:hypothetical protein [Spirosoma endophyticum]|uniref:Uncharacterized protein n=1 Tax=Spirosoma endophyticum TaxID=662367 RepID=A0A1I1SC22_9BACT|nr:hypothetical protein [Spirosoma endophyticum]SFD43872.1 hypothetical protein SAMN05216167_10544 [Spirosoma endophyticum]